MEDEKLKISLMRHYYQTGNNTAAKDLYKKLIPNKTRQGNTEMGEVPNGDFSGAEEAD